MGVAPRLIFPVAPQIFISHVHAAYITNFPVYHGNFSMIAVINPNIGA